MSTTNDDDASKGQRRRRRWYGAGVLLLLLLLQGCATPALAKEAAASRSSSKDDAKQSKQPPKEDPVIEEVTSKQLERLLKEKDFVAVYWYARSCVTCDKVLAELEKIDDDTDTFGVDFVKINDKRLAKQYGIKTFPALTYFREKEPIIYEGDLMDEENVLEFLTSLEAMDLPDRIEEVNAKILTKIIEDTDFVAVLFCPEADRCAGTDFNKPECKKCARALQELENIDDEADQLGIGFVKIADERLAEEYNLGQLPVLVYYRHQIPIVYEHELSREEDVLEWLVANKSTGDEEDVIEEVTAKTLGTLIGNIDNLVVLFYKHGDEDSMLVLEELEKIDDDCDKHGIQFVKIDDKKTAKEFGIDSIPGIVYFEKQLPNVYDGDLHNEDEILEWLLSQLEKDEIEDVTDEMLDAFVKEGKTLAVLFYDNNDRKSQRVLNELENIDDECDTLGITFVKIDNAEEAKEYGIDKIPSLLYFEKGIPTLYEGNLEDEEKVLKWLENQKKSDHIEDITDEMLDMVIDKMPHVAVLFYDKEQKKSAKVLAELENIDDDCDEHNIAFVKIDDAEEAKEYGIDELPTLVLFEKKIPHVYDGDLMNEDQLLGWLLHQKKHSEIPEVTDEMMEKLIETTPFLAVLFYDKDDKQDIRILNELENIDDDLAREGITIIRMDNDAEAKEYGIDHLPTLVYFEDKIPALYEGDLLNEDEVLKWLIEQKNTATIEEVTDEILSDLIDEHEYVVVYFSGNCDDGDECDKILKELENIDDELDETGIVFVTTEDTGMAKKHGIKNLPTLAFFRNKEPLIYKGDIEDEDEVLSWLTDENTLEIPGKIEEVNGKMLENILDENNYVVVFFYKEGDKKSQKILQELENIDEECEEKNIDFVKISDEGIEKEYDLPSLPSLAFYRNKFRQIYSGDMMHEEQILEWVLDLRTSQPDVIENVDRKTLQLLINDVEHLAVFFYNDDCDNCKEILEELETIDDDTDKHGIQFVKSQDAKLAAEIGIFSFPALVYYETGVPIMYDGNLKKEDEVLEWLIEQKSNDNDDDDNDDNDDSGDDEKASRPQKSRKAPVKSKTVEKKNKKVVAKAPEVKKKVREAVIKYKKRKVVVEEDDDEDLNNSNDDGNEDDEDNDSGDDNDDEEDEEDEDDEEDEEDSGTGEDFEEECFDDEDADDEEDEDLSGDEEDDDKDNDDDEEEENEEDNESSSSSRAVKNFVGKGDGCFYIGMGAKSAKPTLPSYEPYQCCPSVVSHTTKVAKVSRTAVDKSKRKDDKSSAAKRPKLAGSSSSSSSSGLKSINKLSAKDSRKTIQPPPVYKPKKEEKPKKEPAKAKKGFFGSGNLLDEAEVLDWILRQKNDASIEEIDRDTLFNYIETKEFLAVVFYKADDPESPRVLRHIELIDGEATEYGIKIVKMSDRLMAKKYGFRNPPGITYFRKGKSINYDGDIDDEEEILDWLTNPGNMELNDHIERVNRKMFHKIRQNSDYVAVFFYSNDCKQCGRVLAEIEHIDDEADSAGINFIKIDDKQLAKQYGVFALPGILFFKLGSKEPVIYAGDLYDEQQILQWLMTQKDPSGEKIEDLNGEDLLNVIRESESLAVYFWNKTFCDICAAKAARKPRRHKPEPTPLPTPEVETPEGQEATATPPPPPPPADDGDNCEHCAVILEELENIDDDCEKHGINFVKTEDFKVAEDYGVTDFPVLVYYENQIPNVFEGNLEEEEEVLQWLITQKTEDRIELITRTMLESFVEDTQYLAVYFYKQNCFICDEILEGLEKIDDECDVFGINFVKIQDPQLAKRYSIKTFPALVYFRNGNPLLFEGDLQNEESVLEWLIDDDNRELADEIESVNARMLDRLLDESPFLAVFFYEEECPECEEIMEALEKIDGEADMFGIDFVKVSDPDASEKFGILNVPSLVYFRKKMPLMYDGDLTQEEKILAWLTSQDVFEIKNEIEEVNKKMLDKLLDENEFLGVFFYEIGSKESEEVNGKLENIDTEIENLDITFVKMADPRYARKWGVTKLPAVVYFRKRFPSIFRGDIKKEEDILEWLRKNRFRQPELNIYMYMLIAVAIMFAMYTGFLLSCFRSEPATPAIHPKQA